MQMGGTGRHEVKLSDLIRKLRAAPPDQDTDVYSFDRDSQVFSEAPQLVQSLLDTGSTHLGDVMDNAPSSGGTSGRGRMWRCHGTAMSGPGISISADGAPASRLTITVTSGAFCLRGRSGGS
eukprot:COSAG04_NODE_1869_length_5348_cov_1.671366_6_plen_122_part_00